MDNKKWYLKGVKDGIPIALGYFAVSFTLGILAKKAGITAFQAMLATGLTNASAGGYAAFNLIGEDGSYLALALTELIVNARYLLMSCALSQKFSPKTSIIHRMLVAFNVTDEVFGISVSVKGNLNPYYNYGASSVSIPGWALGTFFGVVMGNVLPASAVSALSVGLYGMFLAIIIPPAKRDKVIAGIIPISMLSSLLFAKLPYLSNISSGMRVIILTVAISLICAILFPKEEESDEA
ncbi:MAG: AzlC family ABC transporter permease [Clostridia bacterium]|nr:AzlC family ABC transporter permease [Clostridia bacterium]